MFQIHQTSFIKIISKIQSCSFIKYNHCSLYKMYQHHTVLHFRNLKQMEKKHHKRISKFKIPNSLSPIEQALNFQILWALFCLHVFKTPHERFTRAYTLNLHKEDKSYNPKSNQNSPTIKNQYIHHKIPPNNFIQAIKFISAQETRTNIHHKDTFKWNLTES